MARGEAERVGPTGHQIRRYLARVELCRAIQRTQAAVLQAVQRAESGADTGRHAHRRAWLVAEPPQPGRARGRPPPVLLPGELRTWGPHLVRAAAGEGFQCIACKRQARGTCTKRKMAKLLCLDRRGLTRTGMSQPQWERWNTAWVQRWAANVDGPGAHDACRYNATSWDGRHLCLRCGLHYVRRCDLVRVPCPGAPQTRKARMALEAAQRGDPLPRRAVSSRAAHPSGANLRAAGQRHPAHDAARVRVEPRPPGPGAGGGCVDPPDSQPQHLGPLSAFGFRVLPQGPPERGREHVFLRNPRQLARPKAATRRVTFEGIRPGAQGGPLATALGATVRPDNPFRGSEATGQSSSSSGNRPGPERPPPGRQEALPTFFQRTRPLEPD